MSDHSQYWTPPFTNDAGRDIYQASIHHHERGSTLNCVAPAAPYSTPNYPVAQPDITSPDQVVSQLANDSLRGAGASGYADNFPDHREPFWNIDPDLFFMGSDQQSFIDQQRARQIADGSAYDEQSISGSSVQPQPLLQASRTNDRVPGITHDQPFAPGARIDDACSRDTPLSFHQSGFDPHQATSSYDFATPSTFSSLRFQPENGAQQQGSVTGGRTSVHSTAPYLGASSGLTSGVGNMSAVAHLPNDPSLQTYGIDASRAYEGNAQSQAEGLRHGFDGGSAYPTNNLPSNHEQQLSEHGEYGLGNAGRSRPLWPNSLGHGHEGLPPSYQPTPWTTQRAIRLSRDLGMFPPVSASNPLFESPQTTRRERKRKATPSSAAGEKLASLKCIDCDKFYRQGKDGRCSRCDVKEQRRTAQPPTFALDPSVPDLLAAHRIVFAGFCRKTVADAVGMAEVKSNEQMHLQGFIEAVNSVSEREEDWNQRQQTTFNQSSKMEADGAYSNQMMTARLRFLFHCTVAYHEGCKLSLYPVGGDNRGYVEKPHLTIHDRLEKVKAVLKDNKRVVMDVIEGRGVMAFASNPEGYNARKVSNDDCNKKKAETMEKGKKHMQSERPESGPKKRRKRKSGVLVIEETGAEAEAADTETLQTALPSKRPHLGARGGSSTSTMQLRPRDGSTADPASPQDEEVDRDASSYPWPVQYNDFADRDETG